MDLDQWEIVEGFPRYLIHPKLGIKNATTNKILKGYIPKGAYPTVKLIDYKQESKLVKIHRLLAIHFIPNPENLPLVNHKDGNKSNYSLDNLEWVSHKDNSKHAHKTGLVKKEKPGVSMDILDEHGNILKTFIRVKDTAAFLGVSDRTIHNHFEKKMRSDGTIVIDGKIVRYSPPEKDLIGEEWVLLFTDADVPCSKYEISTKGRVRNALTKYHIVSHLTMGYPAINLKTSKGSIVPYVHRLMAFSFMMVTEERFDVNHKDKNKENNVLENLEIMSRKEHLTKDHGRRIKAVKDEMVLYFDSIAQAAEEFGVCMSSIQKSLLKSSKCKTWIFYDV